MTQRFQYLRPKSPGEACELKAKHGQKAVSWAERTINKKGYHNA